MSVCVLGAHKGASRVQKGLHWADSDLRKADRDAGATVNVCGSLIMFMGLVRLTPGGKVLG